MSLWYINTKVLWKKGQNTVNQNKYLAQKNKFYVSFITFENTEVTGSNMFNF
jgi:hypothetical protein